DHSEPAPSSRISSMYRGAPCDFQKLTTDSTSASLTNAPWMRVGLPASTGWYSMSPRPSSFSAPPESRMTRLSTCDPTANAMREGMLALMRPVMMSVDGRCVAMTRWMPTARASCAMRHTREVAHDRGAGHVVAQGERERMRALAKRSCFKDLANCHKACRLVRHLDADRRLTGNRGLDAQRRGGQGQRQVVLKSGDLLH